MIKGQRHSDDKMFCRNTFLAIDQHHNSRTDTVFHISLDTELVTLILCVHLKTHLIA